MAKQILKSGVHEQARWRSVRDQQARTYLANGVDSPQVWDGVSAALRNWGIAPPLVAPVASVGAAGVLTGDYTWFVSYVNKDVIPELVSNPSLVSNQITLAAQQGNIDFSTGLPPGDSQVTHWRLWRNTAGQATAYFQVADIAIATTTHIDNIADSTIEANIVMPTNHLPPSARKPFVANHQGILHLFGSRIEDQGTISISAGTPNVVGAGTHFSESHVGLSLYIPEEGTIYTVDSVASTTSLTLTANHTAGVSAGTSYKIWDQLTQSEWTWSLGGQYEYFPAANGTNIFENDGDFPTGMFSMAGTLQFTKRSHVYRALWAADPNPATGGGAIFEVLPERGAVNNECIVVVDNNAYMLDEKGIYLLGAQASAPTEIDQAVRRLLQPSDEPKADRVNWEARHTFHAIHDPKRDRVMVFVALGTDTVPRHAFVFERLLKRWSVEEYQFGITSSTLQRDSGGRVRPWVGDLNGYLWAIGVGKGRDGAPPRGSGTLLGTATSATATTLTDSGATFYTTGDALGGVPVYINRGTGAGQFRVITTNTATELTVEIPFSPVPDATSEYMVGAIEMLIRSIWLPLEEPALKKRIKSLRLFFEPTTEETICSVRMYRDLIATPFLEWSPGSDEDGINFPLDITTTGIIEVDFGLEPRPAEIPVGDAYFRWFAFDITFAGSDQKPKFVGWEVVSEPLQKTGRTGV